MKIIFKLTFETILILIFLVGNFLNASAESFWYLSPGLRIGWNFSGNFTVDGKISIGLNTDDNLNKITFCNITLGFNALAFAKAKENKFNEYNYVQFQAGSSFLDIEDNLFITGMGAGFIFNTNNKNDFSPIIRLFSGFIVFPELDLIFLKRKQIVSYFGVRGVIPGSMQKINIGFD